MAPMSPVEQIFLPIKDALAKVEHVILDECRTNVSTITQVIEYIIAHGGKRIRPALTIMSARITGYNGDNAPRVGAALEMVHTASLLHDDVVDNAPTRRGAPSANSKWGNQISVLVGDFFWCKACQIIVDMEQPKVLRAITDAVISTTEGEVIELIHSNDVSMSEEEYLRIIKYKTARLMAVSCRTGAMLSGASENLEAAVSRYGLDLGIAFQLADDALDYDSDEERFGKSRGTDLREGHLTLPLILALQRCEDNESSLIKEALLSQTLDDTQFADVLTILERYQCIKDTRAMAQRYVDQAIAHLEPFKPSLDKDALVQLAHYVVHRGE